MKEKMYVIKKYIMATSAREALRKEKITPADDCWIDEKWRESERDNLANAIGFVIEK